MALVDDYLRSGTFAPVPFRATGPYPGEETCPDCNPVGTWGSVPADDPRFLGGVVDAERNRRADPLRHSGYCPRRFGEAVWE